MVYFDIFRDRAHIILCTFKCSANHSHNSKFIKLHTHTAYTTIFVLFSLRWHASPYSLRSHFALSTAIASNSQLKNGLGAVRHLNFSKQIVEMSCEGNESKSETEWQIELTQKKKLFKITWLVKSCA